MDKSPTMGKSPSLPGAEELLQKVQELSEQNQEYVGTTLAKVLASPLVLRSPAMQAKMQELLEHVIDPETRLDDQDAPGLDYGPVASPSVKKLATPTLKKMPQVLEPIGAAGNTGEVSGLEEQVLPKSPVARGTEGNEIGAEAGIDDVKDDYGSPAAPRSPAGAAADPLAPESLLALDEAGLAPTPEHSTPINIDLVDQEVVPDLERSVRLLNLSQVEREFPEDLDLARKLDQIFDPVNSRSCYDVKRCSKLNSTPAPQCVVCQRREAIEVELLGFIQKYFRNEKIGLFDVISEDMMRNLDESAYNAYIERKATLMQEFGVGPNEHFANLAGLRFGAPLKIHQAMMQTERRMCDIFNKHLEDEAVRGGKDASEVPEEQKAKTLKEKGVQVKKVTPVFILAQLICEAVFNVPGYTAFCLMPVLRSRYKYLHPDYAQGLVQFPTVREVRKALRIAGPGVPGGAGSPMGEEGGTEATEAPCTITGPQIREFYLQHIAKRTSTERFINCLKDLDLSLELKGRTEKILEKSLEKSSDPHSDATGVETVVQKQCGSISYPPGVVTPEDLDMYLTVVCRLHPGLEFLRATPDFQAAYVATCVERVMVECDQRWSGYLTPKSVSRGNLLGELWGIQRAPDLNRSLRYFSYEHFYVIYCQFWQLDTDHDQLLSAEDLANYGAATCPYLFYCHCAPGTPKDACKCQRVYNIEVVHRLFSGVGFPLQIEGKLTYGEFVRFILAEECKDSAWGQELFFRLLDVDGDGVLGLQDYSHFFPEMQRLYKCHGRELNWGRLDDLMCQLTDAAHHTQYVPGLDVRAEPFARQCIARRDVRRSRVPGNFFNPFISFLKAQQFDIKDPYSIKYPPGAPEKTSWDRFARAMYDLMEDGEAEAEAAQGLDGGALD